MWGLVGELVGGVGGKEGGGGTFFGEAPERRVAPGGVRRGRGESGGGLDGVERHGGGVVGWPGEL